MSLSVIWRLFFITFLLMAPAPSSAQARDDLHQTWRWSHFGAADGLPHDSVTQLVESADGTLWVGTPAGIAWFDGYLWVRCGSEAGLPEEAPGSLTALSDNRVVATFSGRVYVGDATGFEALDLPLHASSVGQMPTGGLAILSRDSQLLRWEGGRLSPLPTPEGVTTDEIVAIRVPTLDDLFLQSIDALHRLSGTTWVPEQTGLSLYNLSVIEAGLRYASNELPVKERGLWSWRAGEPDRRRVGGVDDLVRTIAAGPAGRLIVVYESGAVLFGDHERLQPLQPVPGPLRSVGSVLYRRNGDLALGTAEGVYLYRTLQVPWTHWYSGEGSQRNRVDEILVARDGSVWLGTDAGLEVRHADGRIEWLEDVLGQPLSIITGLGEDDAGGIWVSSGAYWEGAFRFFEGTWRFYGAQDGLSASKIHRIHRDRSGRLWFLGLKGTEGSHRALRASVVTYERERFAAFPLPDSLGGGRIHSFSESPDGALWLSGVLGIGRWRDGAWRIWRTDGALRGDAAFVVTAGVDGRLFFADRRNGLGIIEADSVRYIDTRDGLINDQVWDLEVGADGTLWATTRGGLSAYHDDGWTSYDASTGLQALELWPVAAHGDQLFVGSAGKGTFILDRSRAQRQPPRIVFQQPVVSDEEALLRWTAHAYMGMIPSPQIRTRFVLDGGPWSSWSTRRDVELSGLRSGDHRLQVQAKGQFGVVSRPDFGIEFSVQPVYYRRPLFFIPVSVSALAVILLSTALVVRRRRHTAALTESEDRYRSFFEEAPISLWEHSYAGLSEYLEGFGLDSPDSLRAHLQANPSVLFECMKRIEILDANQASVELFEAASADQLLHQKIRIFRRDSFPAFLEGMVTVASGGERFSHETWAHTLEGKPLNVILSWVVAPGCRDYSRVLVSVLDITAQHQAAEEMRRAVRTAEEANVAKSAFLANTSHEIRTPINAIMGMAQALQDEDLPPRVAAEIDVVLSASESLSTIVNDLLDESKIEAGQLELEAAAFDPGAVLEEVRRTLMAPAADKDLSLMVSTEPEVLPMVVGDAVRLQQVLMNLVANAVKFTDHGGVEVRMRTEASAEAVVLHCVVQDSGIGIAPDRVEAIFDPFTQADNSISRTHGGTGLGLSICRRLVELMGGEIDVDSRPGRGSTFRFHVHLQPHSGIAEVAPAEPAPAQAGPRRILLVEDNDLNRKVVHALLRREEHDIVEAINGRQAVEAHARSGPFDVILMDVQMPEMDGLTATAHIRSTEAEEDRPRTPIIALTANAMKGHRDQCLAAGMDDFLSKPVRKEELRQALAAVSGSGVSAPPSDPSFGGQAVIDPSVLEGLRELEEQVGFTVAGFVGLFLDDTPARLRALRSALDAGDAVVSHREAHTIKGSCREVGALAAAGRLVDGLEVAVQEAGAQLQQIVAE